MKKFLLVVPVLALFVITACGPAKVAVDPYVGAWSTTIKGTPQGDVGSVMTITKDENNTYEASVESDLGNFMLENLTIENNQLKSTLMVQDIEFDFTGSFSGDNFNGTVSNYDGEYEAVGTRMVDKGN